MSPFTQISLEHFHGQWAFNMLLDSPLQWTGTKSRVITFLGQEGLGCVRKLKRQVLVFKPFLQVLELNFHNGIELLRRQIVEDDTINLNIASTCLHYGQECFEGIKVFEQQNGKISFSVRMKMLNACIAPLKKF